MRVHEDRLFERAGGGSVAGDAAAVTIRPPHRIVKMLRAVGLCVELKRIGWYVVPIVTTERPPT
jgi:hypothetical protein